MKDRPLTPVLHELFWYFLNERHAIYLKKSRGEPKPWSEDWIFQQYKFTNVFRELDAGTVWLRENFLQPHWHDSLDLLVFNVCWYRLFNWTGTGKLLGWQTHWDPVMACTLLETALASGKQVFTGAHIVRSEFFRPKIPATIDVCTALWDRRHHLVKTALDTQSLEQTFKEFLPIQYIGPFMAHEFVQDLRHTPILEQAHDVNTWSNAGPGAMRGLQRLGFPFRPPKAAIESMIFLLAQSPQHLQPHVPPLELHQVEFVLCELDKYARIKCGEGKPRAKYAGAA